MAVTRQSHEIGEVEAKDEAEAVRKAGRIYKERLERAAKRCYKTKQLHEVYAFQRGDDIHGEVK